VKELPLVAAGGRDMSFAISLKLEGIDGAHFHSLETRV